MLGKRRYSRSSRSSFRKKGKFGTLRRKGMRARKLKSLKAYNVHMYKRWGSALSYSMTSATSASFSETFALANTVNATELTALYDQYQILGVKVKFQLLTNPDSLTYINTNTQNNPYNVFPKLWYVRDYDDSPTETIDALRQRNNVKCKILRPNQFVSVFIKPAVRNQVYLDGITTATSPIWKPWLDCSNSSVPHYGLKFAIDNNGNSNAQTLFMRAEVVYYLKFKNAR